MNAHSDQEGAAGANLPVGTVTFLFADVEGSTEALERHGEAYAELLGRFRVDSATLVAQSGGTLVQTEGDGVFAVFPTADAALQAAVAAQRTYLSYPAPGPLRVRVGLHSGTGMVVAGIYAGIDVHRAARVAAAAPGGQVLLTDATRELVRDRAEGLVEGLGWFELKGLARSEHLHQLSVPGLPRTFPPVRARPSARADLPRHLTPLFGREADIEAIGALLETGVRLLTLTGPGGVGKTRLAVAVAERVASRYPDAVSFVGLASVADGARVAETIAARLGRSIEGSVSAEDVLVDELQDRQLLLVLDNFEQVIGGAPCCTACSSGCPGCSSWSPAVSPCTSRASGSTRLRPCRCSAPGRSRRSGICRGAAAGRPRASRQARLRYHAGQRRRPGRAGAPARRHPPRHRAGRCTHTPARASRGRQAPALGPGPGRRRR